MIVNTISEYGVSFHLLKLQKASEGHVAGR